MAADTNPDILRLAYDAAIKGVELQDGTLTNIRNRATGLLSAVTIATTFGAGLGLFSDDPTKGNLLAEWSQWTLLALLLGVGGLCIAVMWPVTMAFGVDPRLALQRAAETEDVGVVQRYLIDELVGGHTSNGRVLARKFFLYRLAVVALTAETGVLVLALILKGK